jgi:hypothetical protein
MNPIRRSHLIRRLAGVLAGMLAPITTASAAFASPLRADPPGRFRRAPPPTRLPPLPPGWNKHPPLPTPAHVHAVLADGMTGWQITLITAGTVVLAAVLAVLAARVRAARRHVPAATNDGMTASGATR